MGCLWWHIFKTCKAMLDLLSFEAKDPDGLAGLLIPLPCNGFCVFQSHVLGFAWVLFRNTGLNMCNMFILLVLYCKTMFRFLFLNEFRYMFMNMFRMLLLNDLHMFRFMILNKINLFRHMFLNGMADYSKPDFVKT